MSKKLHADVSCLQVMHKGLFYWTNGDEMIREELDPFTNMYHHNQMFFFDSPFTGLNLWHPSAQPIPVPLGPPKNIQATFKSDSAHITWDLPEIEQGKCSMLWFPMQNYTTMDTSNIFNTVEPWNVTTLII